MNLFGEPELGIDYIEYRPLNGHVKRKLAGVCSFCKKPGFFVNQHRKCQKHDYCNRECYRKHFSILRRDSNHPNWIGGLSNQIQLLRDTEEYKEWRRQVWMKDDYTCQECSERGGNLVAHHLVMVSEDLDLVYVVDNGLTMCIPCHQETFGHEIEYREDYFIRKGLTCVS